MVLHLPFLASNWNLKMLVLEVRGKLEYLEENLSEQEREPTTNSAHIIQLFQEWFLEKVHATIPKGIVGSFEFTVFQKNFKQWH